MYKTHPSPEHTHTCTRTHTHTTTTAKQTNCQQPKNKMTNLWTCLRSPERDNTKPRHTLSRQLNRLNGSSRCSCCLALSCREREIVCAWEFKLEWAWAWVMSTSLHWNVLRCRCTYSLYCLLARTHMAHHCCCCCSVCLLLLLPSLLPSLAVNRFTLRAKLTLALSLLPLLLLLQKFLALSVCRCSVLSGILRPPRRAGQREQQQQHEQQQQQQQQHKSALDSLVR